MRLFFVKSYVNHSNCLFLLSNQTLMNVATVTANSCVPTCLVLTPAPVTLALS